MTAPPNGPQPQATQTHATQTHAAQEARLPAERARTSYQLLDAWRGIAALWVVAHHAASHGLVQDYPQLQSAPLFWPAKWGVLGVPLFFVISGYCITAAALAALRRAGGIGDFVRARLRRIFLPYWATVLVAVCAISLMLWLQAHHLPFSGVVSQYPLWHQPRPFYFGTLTLTQLPLIVMHRLSPESGYMLGVFWTLCYEIAFYALVAAAMLGALRWSKRAAHSGRAMLNLLHALTLGTLLIRCFTPRLLPFPLDLWAQFGVGALLFDGLHGAGEARESEGFGARPAWLLGGCALLMAVQASRPWAWSGAPWQYGGRDPLHLGALDNPLRSFVCLGFAVLLALLFRWDARFALLRPVRALMGLGAFSYSLYLTHQIVIPVVRQVMVLKLPGAGWLWLSVLIQLGAAVIFARVFYLVAERPFLRRKAARQGATPAQAVSEGAPVALQSSR